MAKITVTNGKPQDIDVPDGATYGQALETAGLAGRFYAVRVGGVLKGFYETVEDGVYRLFRYSAYIEASITLRGESGDRDRVVIEGRGYGPLAEALTIAAPEVTIADLTVTQFRNHAISVKGEGGAHDAQIYNVHLLVGKIAEPGNSPFSLTGQPSACGTAREVGTFAHRLPADMVVKNEKHRAFTEEIWDLPEGTIPGKPGYHAVLQNRMLKDGKLNAYWVMCNNNMQAAPNMNEEGYPGYRNPENFIVVSDPYPTVTAQAAECAASDAIAGSPSSSPSAGSAPTPISTRAAVTGARLVA